MRIAYVEDNPTNLALVERVAGMNHHVVVSYNEGEVAVKELLNETFDLILMDVELAGELGGLAVVRELRKNGLNTPIVAVTAYAMMGDRDKCLEAGCDDYLPKPLPIVELVAMLARYDEMARRIAAGEPAPERKSPVVAVESPTPPAPPAPPTPSTAPVPTSSESKPVAPVTDAESRTAEAAKAPEAKLQTSNSAPAINTASDRPQDHANSEKYPPPEANTPDEVTISTDNTKRNEPL